MPHPAPCHVWVALDGRWHERSPGVLLDWAQVDGRWRAHVFVGSGGGMTPPSGAAVWVDAACVRPADATKPPA